MLHAWIIHGIVANLVPSSIFVVAMLDVIGKISQNLIVVSAVVTAIRFVMIQTWTVATVTVRTLVVVPYICGGSVLFLEYVVRYGSYAY